jgi:hypothetical protein
MRGLRLRQSPWLPKSWQQKTGARGQSDPAPVLYQKKRELRGFSDFSGLDATGTNLHSLSTTLGQLHANGLQVRIKPPRRSIVSVGNIIPELRAFSADFATFSHNFYDTSKAFECRAPKTEWLAIIETQFITNGFPHRQAGTSGPNIAIL